MLATVAHILYNVFAALGLGLAAWGMIYAAANIARIMAAKSGLIDKRYAHTWRIKGNR